MKQDFQNEYGVVGTNILGGFIDFDYQSTWKSLRTRIDAIDEMVGSDATVKQIYDAVRLPILSAYYFLTPADDSKEAQMAKEFIEENIFCKINFQSFLENVVTYKKYGFSLFAINYQVLDGKIYLKNLKPITQKSLHTWGNGSEWVDGHPVGITQYTNRTDETNKAVVEFIPWERLLRFTNEETGNNFEGISVFRSAYAHWYFKNLFYKLSAIAVERFGVGTPTMKVTEGTTEEELNKLEQALKRLKSNEQGYLIYKEGNEFKIVAPDGGAASQHAIAELIRHQDKKIYDSVSCGFLNLTSGDGGSHGLSKDQHQYFMESLQASGDYIISKLQELINTLCAINNITLVPEIGISDLGEININDFVNSIATAKRDGLITYQKSDEAKIRSQLKLDPLPDDADPKYEEKTANALFKKKINKFVKISDREKEFVKNISDFENYLNSEYATIEQIFDDTYEKKFKPIFRSLYNQADTEGKDGFLVFANTTKNRNLLKEAKKELNKVTDWLRGKVIDSSIQDRIFKSAEKQAIKGIQDAMMLESVYVDRNKFNGFIAGYISNVEGVLYNEPRKLEEKMVADMTQKVSTQLAIDSVEQLTYNKNILKLSVITHPRGAYNAIQYDQNVKDGYTFFKILAPKSKIKGLDPTGQTASLLYKIMTAAELNNITFDATDGKNTSAISGLGIHYGSFVYFLAISSLILEEEKKIADEQRAQLLEDLAPQE